MVTVTFNMNVINCGCQLTWWGAYGSMVVDTKVCMVLPPTELCVGWWCAMCNTVVGVKGQRERGVGCKE